MMYSFADAYDCVKVFSDTCLRDDLNNIDIPVLVLHGGDDQVVPVDAGDNAAVKLLKHGTPKEFSEHRTHFRRTVPRR